MVWGVVERLRDAKIHFGGSGMCRPRAEIHIPPHRMCKTARFATLQRPWSALPAVVERFFAGNLHILAERMCIPAAGKVFPAQGLHIPFRGMCIPATRLHIFRAELCIRGAAPQVSEPGRRFRAFAPQSPSGKRVSTFATELTISLAAVT